ncbi:MAG TPA: type II secretion system F family protein [Vicinamibacterales bacterium]|nr:type II secretion system F family protein [Vicinamibacterales bacterium]
MGFAAVAFAVVLGVILSVYWFFIVRTEEQAQQNLRGRLRRGSVRDKARLEVLKATEPSSNLAGFDRLLKRLEVVNDPLRRFIEASGSGMTPGLFLLMTGVCLLGTYLLVDFFSPWQAVAVVLAFVAACIPYWYLRYRQMSRLRKFEEQFPDSIDLIARALRAGHAFTTGLGMVAEEVPDPVGSEFRLLYEHQNFGLPLPEAMKKFAERLPLLDARFFVTAVLTQRESGGNLSEVLDNLSAVIRERFKVKRQVRVLTAHGRITGWVLVALPPIMAVVFFMLIPDTMMLLVTDPMGINMVIAAVIMQIVGTLVIRKLVDIEY